MFWFIIYLFNIMVMCLLVLFINVKGVIDFGVILRMFFIRLGLLNDSLVVLIFLVRI